MSFICPECGKPANWVECFEEAARKTERAEIVAKLRGRAAKARDSANAAEDFDIVYAHRAEQYAFQLVAGWIEAGCP